MSEYANEPIPPHLIEEALGRVLASRGFRGSARNRRFLKFVVEETQAGHANRIKAFTIAMDVFDRDANFDPLLDPVVRIQAGRIRRCLEQYYLTEGACDPVHISIPKGGYVPRFTLRRNVTVDGSPNEPGDDEGADTCDGTDDRMPATASDEDFPSPPASPQPPRLFAGMRPRAIIAAGILATVFVLLLMIMWFTAVTPHTLAPQASKGGQQAARVREPSLLVLPFGNGTGDPAQDIFAEGFTEDLIGALIRFKNVFVFGADTSFQYRSVPGFRRAEPNVDLGYVLKGSINRAGDQIQINATLISAKDQRYIWSNSYRGNFSPSNMMDVRQDIATQVASTLAQPYGVIYKEEVRTTATRAPDALSSYECMLRTRQYWRQMNQVMHAQVRTCLERATETDPLYADAWAALAMIYVDEIRLGFNPTSTRPDPASTGLQLAKHAVALNSDNPLSYQALGLAYWLGREPKLAIAAYEKARALNPNDSDILADLGRCYSLIGNWEKGIPLIREAFTRNPAHPSWYRIIFALYHYVHGQYEEALEEATRVDLHNVILSHVALAMIHGQTGHKADAANEIKEILRLDPRFGEKVIAEMERRNIEPSIIAKIVDGLQKAGLTVTQQSASTEGRSPTEGH